GKPQPGLIGFAEEMTKYAAMAYVGGTPFAAAGAPAWAVGLGGGALADSIDNDANLANMWEEQFPGSTPEFVAFMAAREDDSEAEQALKSVVTGMVPAATLEVLLKGLKGFKKVRKAQAEGKPIPEDAVKEVEDAFADLSDDLPDPKPQANVASAADEAAEVADPLADFHAPPKVAAEGDLQAVAKSEEGFQLGFPRNEAVNKAEGDLAALA